MPVKANTHQMQAALRDAIEKSGSVICSLGQQADAIASLAHAIVAALQSGHKVLTAGHGGSAAQAMDKAEELMGRFKANRRSLPAVALTADSTLVTCIANDFGFDQLFPRQIEGLGASGDVLIIFSTSGNGNGFRAAIEIARSKVMMSVALLGKAGGQIRGLADHEVIVASDETARVQEAHLLILHLILEIVEQAFADRTERGHT